MSPLQRLAELGDVEVENARIESTRLGTEDHGIFTAYLICVSDGTGQGFGGYSLDTYDTNLKRRVGSGWGMEHIARIIDVLRAGTWEQLRGRYLRIARHVGSHSIVAIGHIVEDRWYSVEQHAQEQR